MMLLASPVLRQVQLGEKPSIQWSRLFIMPAVLTSVFKKKSQEMEFENPWHTPTGVKSKEDLKYVLVGFCFLVTEMEVEMPKRN